MDLPVRLLFCRGFVPERGNGGLRPDVFQIRRRSQKRRRTRSRNVRENFRLTPERLFFEPDRSGGRTLPRKARGLPVGFVRQFDPLLQRNQEHAAGVDGKGRPPRTDFRRLRGLPNARFRSPCQGGVLTFAVYRGFAVFPCEAGRVPRTAFRFRRHRFRGCLPVVFRVTGSRIARISGPHARFLRSGAGGNAPEILRKKRTYRNRSDGSSRTSQSLLSEIAMKTYVFSEAEFSTPEDFYDAAIRNFGLFPDF